MSLSHPHIEQGTGVRSTIPDDREGHTASIIGNKIFVFGGTWTDEEDTTIYMNDLHMLDVDTFAWSKPTTSGEPPTEREGHTAATLLKKVFIFGGTWVDEEDNSIYLNDLHVLDTHGDGTVDGRWNQPRTTGMPPIQREGHTASMVRDTMIIFGGAGLDKNEASVNLNDLHLLDTSTLAWSQPQMKGTIPQERRYHTASVVDTKIYIFGGQYYDQQADLHFECDNTLCEFNFESLTWGVVAIESSLPLRRACHSAGVVGRQIFLVGGRYWDVAEDDYIFLNDIQVLDTSPSSTLAVDWSRYFNSEQLSDVTLTVEGCRFPAHRVVLAARCNYFRCMFEIGMREASQAEIDVPDVSLDVFRKLLEHLYTDTDVIPSEIALQLFSAADRFGVERLRQLCIVRVETDMDVESVCNILTVADRHNAAYLKDEAVKFVVSQFAEVHNTEGFKALDRELLDIVHAAISARLFPSKE